MGARREEKKKTQAQRGHAGARGHNGEAARSRRAGPKKKAEKIWVCILAMEHARLRQRRILNGGRRRERKTNLAKGTAKKGKQQGEKKAKDARKKRRNGGVPGMGRFAEPQIKEGAQRREGSETGNKKRKMKTKKNRDGKFSANLRGGTGHAGVGPQPCRIGGKM